MDFAITQKGDMMGRLIDADAFDKCLEDAETEATRMRKCVFASALNTIRGNLRNFPSAQQKEYTEQQVRDAFNAGFSNGKEAIALDDAIHKVWKAFDSFKGGAIIWRDFREVGVEEYYYDWYYAENRLYIIRDRMIETYCFVEAGNPKEALKLYKDRLDDAMRAGEWVEEVYE